MARRHAARYGRPHRSDAVGQLSAERAAVRRLGRLHPVEPAAEQRDFEVFLEVGRKRVACSKGCGHSCSVLFGGKGDVLDHAILKVYVQADSPRSVGCACAETSRARRRPEMLRLCTAVG